MTRLIFLDCETSGLDVRRHEVWEIGAIVRDFNTPEEMEDPNDVEHHWFLPINLDKADLIALNIGKYFERHPYAKDYMQSKDKKPVSNEHTFAREFMSLTVGAFLVGACIDFDATFLKPILYRNNCIPAFNYHLVDVEALAAGALKMQPPWKSDDVYEALGYKRNVDGRHTALGDAREVRDIYDLVMLGE